MQASAECNQRAKSEKRNGERVIKSFVGILWPMSKVPDGTELNTIVYVYTVRM